jgi:anti-anti-sigma factor
MTSESGTESHDPLEIACQEDGLPKGSVHLQLKGRLTRTDVGHFRSEVSRLLESGAKTIDVDLELLTYIDSTGVAEFIPIYQRVREHEATMKVSNPRRLIRHILLSMHLDDILEIGPAHDDPQRGQDQQ